SPSEQANRETGKASLPRLSLAAQPARPLPQAEPGEPPGRRRRRRDPRLVLAAHGRQAALAAVDPDPGGRVAVAQLRPLRDLSSDPEGEAPAIRQGRPLRRPRPSPRPEHPPPRR